MKHAAQTDFTLLGENHDNPDHHRLQGWVIRNVAKQNRKPAIVLEMIEETRQSALDAYQRRPDADAAGLGAAVNWDDSGWPAWADYQPIADAAFESGLPIVAGNPIKPGRGASSRLKMITDARRKALGADQPLASWRQERLLGTIDAGHCGLVPKQHLTPMIAIQRVRDAVLADNLNKAANQTSGSGAILIAGANHARNDFAVPLVLARLAPDATVLSLAFVEVDDSQTNPSDYAQSFNAKTVPFDYIWFTPRANDTDHCADLKEKFSSYKTKPHAKKIKNK
ncbi:MAG: ChaN family lipoprotein [Alphaproteobacteria bacterium]|nr:ChaN family lipoprotein [Alphaproteobacteria bacterium]